MYWTAVLPFCDGDLRMHDYKEGLLRQERRWKLPIEYTSDMQAVSSIIQCPAAGHGSEAIKSHTSKHFASSAQFQGHIIRKASVTTFDPTAKLNSSLKLW